MAIPLLGIASGAVKIGQKIFGGIKKRKEKKAAKKAAAATKAAATAQSVQDQFSALFGGGGGGGATTAQTAIGASSQELIGKIFGGAEKVTLASDADEIRAERAGLGGLPGGGGILVLIGGAIALILLMRGKR